MHTNDRLHLTVSDVACEARDVMVIELRSPDGGDLPGFTAGAHLEISLPNGLVRHYSLCNDPCERTRYRIGVALARNSRGGSRFIHQYVRVGTTLAVTGPRNNFPLDSSDGECVFIAGGIGITPIMAMIRECESHGRSWRLFYCNRTRLRAAFYEDLLEIAAGRCQFHFDDELGGRFFDVPAALADLSLDSHVYCCGPVPLMEAVKAASTHRPGANVHFEWFSAPEMEPVPEKPFRVVVRSTGACYEVPAGKTILQVLEDNGAGVPAACCEGLCATCRTGVVEGIPEHRDFVLSQAERDANDQMMICVSRSRSDVLVLDL